MEAPGGSTWSWGVFETQFFSVPERAENARTRSVVSNGREWPAVPERAMSAMLILVQFSCERVLGLFSAPERGLEYALDVFHAGYLAPLAATLQTRSSAWFLYHSHYIWLRDASILRTCLIMTAQRIWKSS
jgi:hypothetical protein